MCFGNDAWDAWLPISINGAWLMTLFLSASLSLPRFHHTRVQAVEKAAARRQQAANTQFSPIKRSVYVHWTHLTVEDVVARGARRPFRSNIFKLRRLALHAWESSTKNKFYWISLTLLLLLSDQAVWAGLFINFSLVTLINMMMMLSSDVLSRSLKSIRTQSKGRVVVSWKT